jgi:hypothetical protein
MPTTQDLMGGGVPDMVANMLGNNPVAVTAAGTTQATAASIKAQHLVTITAAGGATGVIIGSRARIGTPYYFSNPSATSAVVYAPTGSTLNGAASTTGLTLAQNKAAVFIQMSRDVWVSILTA